MDVIKAERLIDLPRWNIVLTHAGYPLATSHNKNQFALVTSMDNVVPSTSMVINWDDYRTGRSNTDVWMLMTEEFLRTNSTTILSHVEKVAAFKGFTMRGRALCNSELIESVCEQYQQRIETTDESNSDEHRLFDRICMDALRLGASDIHITLFAGSAEIKLRRKGELKHYMDLSRARAESMIASAYNTLPEKGSTSSGFNEREYQDAVIERTYPEGMVRFRYSGLPIAPSGHDITLRLIPLGVETKKRSMIDLGYSEDQVELLDRIFTRSSGMILIAGTTGSGKSTTLSVSLEEMAARHPGKKIRTVEEPVEFRIKGAYQTPILRNEKKEGEPGKTPQNPFLVALRQLMRSDPDVIMVGEIRDIDTANVSIQGVRSGHLLVSTIHADGAPVCYERLSGMGVSRQDLATVGLIAAFIYQKLVPILCPKCKISHDDYAASPNAAQKLLNRLYKVSNKGKGVYFRSKTGCEHCGFDGITHREVVAEILRPTPAMSKHVAAGASTEIWRAWRSTVNHTDGADMTGRTAFEHALWKMGQGRVSPFDVEDAFKFVDEPAFEDTNL